MVVVSSVLNNSYRPSKSLIEPTELRDESECESPSGSEESYEIESSGEAPIVTTTARTKSQAIAEVAYPLPQSVEGGEEIEAKNDDPPNDNEEKGENGYTYRPHEYDPVERTGPVGATFVEIGVAPETPTVVDSRVASAIPTNQSMRV
ncbi:hypothetical protein HAX54_003073 [Datura stramonium]|uniref:Uncharacterized protein n=1 Tax=Datura stramonium TaxID=4076 RepID=A0ABS8WRW0_DATST|nr:hypothetical protein [Datura stramonium]